MKHTITIYPGDYQIKKYEHTEYLFCENPLKKEFIFEGKGYTKDFFKQILSLDLNSQAAILDFTQQYGILVNTQNISDYCTYLGEIITKEISKTYFPFSSGVSISLILFKQSINLIKNILLLATAVSLDSSTNIKTSIQSYSQIVEHFLTVLLQPYSYNNIIQSKINWIFDGNTPLSRLAYYSGEFFRTINPKYSVSIRMQLFICYFDILTTLNNNHFKKFETTNKASKKGKHIIPTFQPINAVKSSNPTYGEFIFTIPTKFAVDFISSDYVKINQIFKDIRHTFDFKLDNDYKFNVDIKNKENLYALMQDIKDMAQKLIVETINTYTENINYELSIAAEKKNNKNYELNLVSKSLLQSIFLEIGNLLNYCQITICKYKKCNNPVISDLSRPALCCCHNHLTNYKSQLKRDAQKNNNNYI